MVSEREAAFGRFLNRLGGWIETGAVREEDPFPEDLSKATQIKGKPGLSLQPSHANVRGRDIPVHRWKRVQEAQERSASWATQTESERDALSETLSEMEQLRAVIQDWQVSTPESARANMQRMIDLKARYSAQVKALREPQKQKAEFYRQAWAHEAERHKLGESPNFSHVQVPKGEFKDADAAEEFLRESYPHIRIFIGGRDGLTPKIASAVARQFVRLSHSFPDAFVRLEMLTIAIGGAEGMFGTARSLDFMKDQSWREESRENFWRHDYEIVLYTAIMGSDTKFKNRAKKCAGWFHPPTLDPAHVFTHEFFHILQDLLGQSSVKEELDKWLADTDPSGISQYARKNEREKFSEAAVWLFHCPKDDWPPGVEELRQILEKHCGHRIEVSR